jgi:hypothetical protein
VVEKLPDAAFFSGRDLWTNHAPLFMEEANKRLGSGVSIHWTRKKSRVDIILNEDERKKVSKHCRTSSVILEIRRKI